jgi:hypothetical protein
LLSGDVKLSGDVELSDDVDSGIETGDGEVVTGE